VFRTLLRRAPEVFERHAGALTPLLPELAADAPLEPPRVLEPHQQRFLLMDAAARALVSVADKQPCLLILEDLHAADPSSLVLLEFVVQQLRTAQLMVLGTVREAEIDRAAVFTELARVERLSDPLRLRRLSRSSVADYLTAAGVSALEVDVEAVFRLTEGHPLYVSELVRRCEGGAVLPMDDALPTGLRALVLENVRRLPAPTLSALQHAAVCGREFSRQLLDHVLGAPAEEPLADALRRHLVSPQPGGTLRFSHVLVRDVLEDSLTPDERAALHARVAASLTAMPVGPAPSELAHHLLAAGSEHARRAFDACLAAAQASLTQLAFDDAVVWFERARASRGSAGASAREQAELVLGLGRALLLAGQRERGRAVCAEARALAEALGDPELFARTALASGSVFQVAMIDRELVQALERALERLTLDSALRPMVLARLAAALQPAPDPQGPMEMARTAVAGARALNEPRVLLDTLRFAVSALMDLGPPAERLQLNREHLALALTLNEPAHAFCALTRSVFDCHELGLTGQVVEAIARAEALAVELAHPTFVWQAEALSAMQALHQRDFAEADRRAALAARAAERLRDPGAQRTLLIQRIRRLELEQRGAEALALVPELQAKFDGSSFSAGFVRVWEAALAARFGAARVHVERADLEALLATEDPSLFELVAEYALATGDAALANKLLPRAEASARACVSWGAFGMVLGGPVSLLREELAAFLNRRSQAPAPSAFRRAPSDEPAARLALERSGSSYRVGFAGREYVLAGRRGLDLLARLVAEPGREFHVLDLSGDGAVGAEGLRDAGDAGPLLDEAARRAYESRLRDLEAELDAAEANCDLGRAEKLRAEHDALTQELARAFGLGGRERRAGAHAERARVNVQRRLKDAVRCLGEHSPELARHLERSVTTGTFCRYDP
jgi:hypothetical protein